jgi:hypothetical protein
VSKTSSGVIWDRSTWAGWRPVMVAVSPRRWRKTLCQAEQECVRKRADQSLTLWRRNYFF